jgi:hypothetical protein
MSAHAYGLSLLRRGPVPRLVSIMAAVILAAVGAQTAPVAAPGHADSRQPRRLPCLGLRAAHRPPQGDL